MKISILEKEGAPSRNVSRPGLIDDGHRDHLRLEKYWANGRSPERRFPNSSSITVRLRMSSSSSSRRSSGREMFELHITYMTRARKSSKGISCCPIRRSITPSDIVNVLAWTGLGFTLSMTRDMAYLLSLFLGANHLYILKSIFRSQTTVIKQRTTSTLSL